ncbi:NADAR family protein [Bdellovibrio sp. HCB337]|uniref:NADAR family protein n=1 Tax=Bdellovibrio sp. HCB337 TaxID=3394358 RepID=UPI0039A6AF1A
MKAIFLLVCLMAASCAQKNVGKAENYKTPITVYQEEILDFYSTKEPYGEFSNFAPYPVFVDEKWWPTSEHYYQAHKYDKDDLIAWVQSAPSPMEAAQRGRDKGIPKRADWDQRKDEFMEKAVIDKFNRYPDLQKLLLSTGNARIYEHTKNDCYWGDCGDRTGKNKLGILLEKIRESLKAKVQN